MKKSIPYALLFAAACLSLSANVALAQSAGGGTPVVQTTTNVSNQPTASSGTLTSVTAGTASASLAAVNASRVYLFVSNEAASNGGTIAVCPSSVSTPAVNAAGCKTLYPGQFWAACSQAFCPSDAFNIIASVAATPVTLGQK